jgi:Uma2 family endonuclease
MTMVEVKLGRRPVILPFTVRIPNVTEEMFFEMVNEDIKAYLIDGVMVVPSPATPRHDDVANFVRVLMYCYADENGLGKVFGPDAMIRLAPRRLFAPDGFFIKADRVPDPLPDELFHLVPNLVYEVLSPSTREYDLEDKRTAFQTAGTEELWFIDFTNEQLIVDRKLRRRYRETIHTEGRVTSSALPGFWLNAEWLWSSPLPSVMLCLREILAG